MRFRCLFVLLVFLFLSCRKEKQQSIAVTEYVLPSEVRLNGLVCRSESEWFVVGGKKREVGYIFQTKDAGVNWSVFETDEPSSLYTLSFRDSIHAMAGGDQCFYWTTSDGGTTWQYQWLADQVPFNGEDRPAIRDIEYVGDSTILFCAGESYNKGVFYRSHDLGHHWLFNFYPHELRSVLVSDQSGRVSAAGYGFGIDLFTDFSVLSISDLSGLYIMDAIQHNDLFFQVDYEGRVYRATAANGPWKEVFSGRSILSKHISLNAISSNGSAIAVVGGDGLILISDDNGQNWKTFAIENNPHLFDIAWTGKNWLAVSDGGVVYAFN